MGDSTVVVNRWRRYGHDRLYVLRGDAVKVGWWDLKTGEAHPETPEHQAALTEAVRVWQTSQPAAAPAVTAKASASVPPPPVAAPALDPIGAAPVAEPEVAVARPWLDLATNRPAAEAREQALAAREAAPVKSLLARVLGVHTDERAWRIGADGEEKVAARLARLERKDPRWRSLHAVQVGNRGADIDHVVIGPGGVFTVNTKHHPGAKIWVGGDTFMVDGHRQPYVRNSRHEAARAAKLLTAACGFSVHVEGIVVTVNADDVVVKNPPSGVHVMARMQIARWLARHGEIHSEQVLDAIFEAARRSTTWRP